MQKFFQYDKNYILKGAQAFKKEELLFDLVEKVKRSYLRNYNPLGLMDDTILQIQHCTDYRFDLLEDYYERLSGIYRYKFSSNQLEFLFDGNTHFNKYINDWTEIFHQWVEEFCLQHNFLKAILEISILYPKDRKAQLAEVRLKSIISQHFEIKVYKFKGIVPMKVA